MCLGALHTGIDAFESNLRRLASTPEGEEDDFALPSGATSLEHMQALRSAAAPPGALLAASSGYQVRAHSYELII